MADQEQKIEKVNEICSLIGLRNLSKPKTNLETNLRQLGVNGVKGEY